MTIRFAEHQGNARTVNAMTDRENPIFKKEIPICHTHG